MVTLDSAIAGVRTVGSTADEYGVTFREIYDSAPDLIPYELPPAIASRIDSLNAILPDSAKLPSAADISLKAKGTVASVLEDIDDDLRPVVNTISELLADVSRYSRLAENALEQADSVLQRIEWLF